MMNKKLLAILTCPRCQQPLEYQAKQTQLVCTQEQLAYPIIDGIPVLLADKAQPLRGEEAHV